MEASHKKHCGKRTRKKKNFLFGDNHKEILGFSMWTFTKKLEARLRGGAYMCMLQAILNISWKSHLTN